jgi:hypothetical protein
MEWLIVVVLVIIVAFFIFSGFLIREADRVKNGQPTKHIHKVENFLEKRGWFNP